ncbi:MULTISPECIES: LLM class flavin-dependent oxidoreductase [unclassified Rhizobium]|uniref:LLM class flavin-dependent oxidoreductase n=1 Tax=unclassified Rhizobium TaxID=2613769 RepID=UPI001FDA1015|nr:MULTISPECIES: LLM class flavin-dependent oxidoreductase [unclassified Rhizobium]MBP2460030.1 FMN-dependent oxidoreductase (nitrilotriacetate monooxygenase family) [Rhizobium sp. PvP014]MBP2531389.1 FMN-dependent oxidoreductase (nitrilotriacetate monooxygenase family) [Rhizobium sp. PvP099]
MSTSKRQMKMVGFLQAQNCSIAPGSWRHPAGATDFLSAEYFQRIGRILEDGKFHLAFFDDRLAMPDIYGDDHQEAVENGVRVVKMDPVSIITAIGMATSHIGLGITYSTTYYEPFHVARLFATLDLMTKGRAAWNVVTSLNNSEAANFGRVAHLAHDLRYERADEFLDVVTGLWNSWEPDALIVDKETGQFADPKKVHRLDHKGKYFSSKGPLPVPPSAQGRPVLIQAGQSGRGREFAGKWGDLIFVVYPTLEAGQKQYAAVKQEVAAAGRNPDEVAICPACYVCVGESQEIAEEKREYIRALAKPIDAVVLLSEALNFDFASKPMDSEFTDEELKKLSWSGFKERVISLSGKPNPTVRDFVHYSGRGTIGEFPIFCGTPTMVADQMEEWFTSGACDGFVLAATHTPGAYEDFVRYVVPELQRRGVYQKDYAGTTLRENLGIPMPVHPAQRQAAE